MGCNRFSSLDSSPLLHEAVICFLLVSKSEFDQVYCFLCNPSQAKSCFTANEQTNSGAWSNFSK